MEEKRGDSEGPTCPAAFKKRRFQAEALQAGRCPFDLVLSLRSNKHKISRSRMQATAKELAEAELGYTDFVASERWLAGFTNHYGLSLRSVTSLTILTDDELVGKA